MTIDESLNKYQIKRIKERLSLNFEEELKKSNSLTERISFFKKFQKFTDIFVTDLYSNGVFFYSFNVHMPFLDVKSPDFWYVVHLQIENWINFFKKEVELVEFCYISIELNKTEKVPYFIGLLGVRSLIGQNEFHLNQMKKLLNFSHLDFSIQKLCSCGQIIKYWNFIIKENNFKFHRFTQYSRYFESFYNDFDHVAFNIDENLDSKCCSIQGIGELNPDVETIINYLMILYFREENIILYKNNVFKKNGTNFEKLGTVEILREKNIKIFNKLKIVYPQQLNGLKISKLFNRGWNKFFEDIKINNHYLDNPNLKKNFDELAKL